MRLSTTEQRTLAGKTPKRRRSRGLYAPFLKRALANGIGKGTFDYRVYHCGWDKERACTEPVGASVGLTKEQQTARGRT